MSAVLKPLRSVRARITLTATALVAVTLVLASAVLLELVREDLLDSAEATIDETLEARAELLSPDDLADVESYSEAWTRIEGFDVGVGIFQVGPDGDGQAFGELYVDDEVVATLVLDVASGEVVEVLDPFFEEPLQDPEILEQVGSLVFEALELSEEDGRYLVGAAPLFEIEKSVDAVEEALVFIVPALTLLLGLSTWVLVGRALRPVKLIASRVEAISSTNLHERVPVPGTGDEVAELAAVMNGMLDRLERGGERQRQFSADASHELRSPLSSVRAAAEVLTRSPTPDRVAMLADDIVAESDRMDLLIGDLLELSRLDEDRRSMAMEELDLVALAADELADELAAGSVTLAGEATAPMKGAASQLRRLVTNLVDNALAHADRAVTVTVDVPADQPHVIRLIVDDDGPGIPMADRDRVFERFARLDEARDRRGGGAGLGLALVKAIVDRHNGTISIDDAPLGGARFTALLGVAPTPDTRRARLQNQG